jgi:hypothetical protein
MPNQQLALDLRTEKEDPDQTFDEWFRSLPKTPG